MKWRVQSHPSAGGKGPSSIGWEYSACQGRGCWFIKKPDTEGYLPITPPPFWSCKPWLSSMSSCVSWEVHYLMASIGSDVIPSAKCIWYGRCSHLLHITWSLHPSSVDALVDIHSRSHNFLLIHPREVLLPGCWVTTQPPCSHGVILLSLPLEVGLTGMGLVHLSHAWQTPDTYTQGNTNLWHDDKKPVSVEDAWLSTLVSHFVGGDICHDLMHHLTCLIFPPIPNLPLSLKGISFH